MQGKGQVLAKPQAVARVLVGRADVGVAGNGFALTQAIGGACKLSLRGGQVQILGRACALRLGAEHFLRLFTLVARRVLLLVVISCALHLQKGEGRVLLCRGDAVEAVGKVAGELAVELLVLLLLGEEVLLVGLIAVGLFGEELV